MEKLIKTGRLFYGIAIAGTGLGQFYYKDFHPMIFPPDHSRIRGLGFWVLLTGAALIIAGLAIVFEKNGRRISLILGGLLLV
ncbi:MAG TPA: hypothetical protein VK772_08885, partial [Puia sp.]|nr:hypothetical protein [Puia sp.]